MTDSQSPTPGVRQLTTTGLPYASITVAVPADAKIARDWAGVTTRFGVVG